jgi:diguanylate cyclase (GGDEF)-like protein/PAS domain S-box-containing protein
MVAEASDGVTRPFTDLARAFELLSDCVALLDPRGDVVDANPFMLNLLGYERDEVLGRSMAEFLHPEDLERAIRVMSMVGRDTLEVPITPAIYRVRRHDGGYLPVEINGTLVLPDEDEVGAAGEAEAVDPEASIVIIGRYSADRDLEDQIMTRLLGGEAPTAVIELIPGFGRWRHQLDHYAVVFTDEGEHRAVAGTDEAVALVHLDIPDSPWDRAARHHLEGRVDPADMPEELARAAAADGLTTCWVQPVEDPMREEAAVILVWGRVGGPDLDVHAYAIDTMARALAVVLRWRHQVTGLRQAARRDPLTGLSNRTGFWEVLDALARDLSGPLVAVLYVDLDGFKAVNDRYGHRTGDIILTEVAQRIAAVVRPGDTIARLGGDEFAIVCRDLEDVGEATAIADRVLGAVSGPVAVTDGLVEVGASVGIATVMGHDLHPDELLDAADRALYAAKRAGRGGWQLTSVGQAGDPPGTLGA